MVAPAEEISPDFLYGGRQISLGTLKLLNGVDLSVKEGLYTM